MTTKIVPDHVIGSQDSTKARLLHAAAHSLIYKSYAKTNLREIAADCDICIASIYSHYPTKNDLILTLIKEELRYCKDNLFLPINNKLSKTERIKSFSQSLKQYFHGRQSAPLIFLLAHELVQIDNNITQEIHAYINSWIKYLEQIFNF